MKRIKDWLMKENRLLLLLWLLAITMVAFALYSWGRLNGWTVVTPS